MSIFELADIGPVYFGLERKILLRDASRLARLAKRFSQQHATTSICRHAGKVSMQVALMSVDNCLQYDAMGLAAPVATALVPEEWAGIEVPSG